MVTLLLHKGLSIRGFPSAAQATWPCIPVFLWNPREPGQHVGQRMLGPSALCYSSDDLESCRYFPQAWVSQSPCPRHISAVLVARTGELFAFGSSMLKYFGQQEYQQLQPIQHHIKAHQPRSAIVTKVSIKRLSLVLIASIFVCKGTSFF